VVKLLYTAAGDIFILATAALAEQVLPGTSRVLCWMWCCMCRWQLPLGVIVRPMADEAFGRPVPVIPLGSHGIVRCRRCRTYMNPFCQWVDGGRRFKCNVCAMLNEVPVEYFSTLDANGMR